MTSEKPRRLPQFVKFMVGTSRRQPDVAPLRSDSTPDALTSVIEVALTPVVFFGIGFIADRHFQTLPLFSLVGVFFGAVGSILRLYYNLTAPGQKSIGDPSDPSASIYIRPNPEAQVHDDGSRSLLGGDLEISEDLRDLASRLDAQSIKADEPKDSDQ